jgi:uncharacterized membrane protein SirB2
VQELCDWLSGTRLSLLIQNVSWIIPAVQSLHILSVAVVMSSMAMLDLRLMGLTGRRQSVSAMAARLLPRMWVALIVLAITGSILVIGEPDRDLPNPAFQTKMAALAAAIVLTLVVRRQIGKQESFWEARPLAAKLAAGASLLLWLGIVVAGRWAAYV